MNGIYVDDMDLSGGEPQHIPVAVSSSLRGVLVNW